MNNYYYNNSKTPIKCFDNCKQCYSEGNEINNNCTQCIPGFTFLNDTESINNNCYKICPFYYYFDKNNGYQCNKTCNKKKILQKRKCIDECN